MQSRDFEFDLLHFLASCVYILSSGGVLRHQALQTGEGLLCLLQIQLCARQAVIDLSEVVGLATGFLGREIRLASFSLARAVSISDWSEGP